MGCCLAGPVVAENPVEAFHCPFRSPLVLTLETYQNLCVSIFLWFDAFLLFAEHDHIALPPPPPPQYVLYPVQEERQTCEVLAYPLRVLVYPPWSLTIDLSCFEKLHKCLNPFLMSGALTHLSDPGYIIEESSYFFRFSRKNASSNSIHIREDWFQNEEQNPLLGP